VFLGALPILAFFFSSTCFAISSKSFASSFVILLALISDSTIVILPFIIESIIFWPIAEYIFNGKQFIKPINIIL